MKGKTEADWENREKTFEQYKVEKRHRFFVGVYLSSLAFAIILPIATIGMSVTVQQALIVIAGLLVLNALDAFRRSMEDIAPTSQSSIFGDTYHVHHYNTTYANTYKTYNQEQDLAKAASEIQQLLNQLSETYPTKTESERIALAEEAVKEIENNPSLKERLMNAIKESSIEALIALIDHPIARTLSAGIQGWRDAETEPITTIEGIEEPRFR